MPGAESQACSAALGSGICGEKQSSQRRFFFLFLAVRLRPCFAPTMGSDSGADPVQWERRFKRFGFLKRQYRDKGSTETRKTGCGGVRPARERCRSGRTGRSRKPLSAQAFRGFESLSLRQTRKCPTRRHRSHFAPETSNSSESCTTFALAELRQQKSNSSESCLFFCARASSASPHGSAGAAERPGAGRRLCTGVRSAQQAIPAKVARLLRSRNCDKKKAAGAGRRLCTGVRSAHQAISAKVVDFRAREIAPTKKQFQQKLHDFCAHLLRSRQLALRPMAPRGRP